MKPSVWGKQFALPPGESDGNHSPTGMRENVAKQSTEFLFLEGELDIGARL
jgi:hypothetical protein